MSLSKLELVKEGRKYWENRIVGEFESASFPHSPILVKSEKIRKESTFTLPQELSNRLLTIGGGSDARLHVILLASVEALIHKYSGYNDFFVGTSVYNQEDDDNLVNSVLLLKAKVEAEMSFKELIMATSGDLKETSLHQSFPVETFLIRKGFSLTDRNIRAANVYVLLNGLNNREYLNQVDSDVIMTFDQGDEIKLNIEFDNVKFDESVIEEIYKRFELLLERVLFTPDVKLEEVDILFDDERTHLNETLSSNEQPQSTFVDVFQELVQESPTNLALTYKDRKFTYSDLNEEANQLARFIEKKFGSNKSEILGIKLDRSLELVTAQLAVFKLGRHFVPIAFELDQSEIDFIADDSGCKQIIDQSTIASFNQSKEEFSKENLSTQIDGNDLAYLVYTSGTNEGPNGVLIDHDNLVGAANAQKELGLNSEYVFGSVASTTNHQSISGIFACLASGVHLVILPEFDTSEISNQIQEFGVSALQLTPTYLDQLELIGKLDDLVSNLKLLVVLGENVNQRNIERLRKHKNTKIVNAYNLTETGFVSFADLYKEKSIGKPVNGIGVAIIDTKGNLLPTGCVGEICVSGNSVSRGYLNRDELTAINFIDNVFRTGDLGKWLPDGTIEFIGRKESLVKFSGYQFNLMDVEDVLLINPLINSAVVVKVGSDKTDESILAYYSAKEDLRVGKIKEDLKDQLYAHMAPTNFIRLSTIPSSFKGKLDKNRLPRLSDSSTNEEVEFVEPRTETEVRLMEVWKAVLGLDKSSIKDDFFQQGGNSIRATMLLVRIHKEFGVKISANDLFKDGTIEYLASEIDTLKSLKDLDTSKMNEITI